MTRLVMLLPLAVLGASHAARADDAAELTTRVLESLHAGASCDDKASPERPWCIAADGWATAKDAPLPKARVLVGVTVTLVDGGVVSTELSDKVSLSALSLRDDKGKTLLEVTAITPTNDDESLAIMKAVGGVSMVLKGKAKKVGLPKALVDYAATLPADAKYEVTHAKSGVGWSWTGASAGELRKVGDAWVVVEQMTHGIYVTVLTDKL